MAWVEAAARGTMTVVTGALEEAEAARTLERRSDEADVRIVLCGRGCECECECEGGGG